jgi:phosphatidate phosphatase APP1
MTTSGSDGAYWGEGREKGARRKKFAGYLKAANDIRQSYVESYSQKWGEQNGDMSDGEGIPGAFPDVAIVSHGDEQLVLFPSYAKRHSKEPPGPQASQSEPQNGAEEPGDSEYWAREWQKFEDDRAIVDVDVRGWIYSPHRGPMTRKNRLLIGLARQLSGIPAPKNPPSEDSSNPNSLRGRHQEYETRREQERIAQEAEQILKKGQGEEQVAAHGGYSERPKDNSDAESIYSENGRFSRQTTSYGDPPGPGYLAKRASWNQPSGMSQDELVAANANLMTRLKPFLTNPSISTPITIFFYDEKTSVSRTVTTNDAGHFNMRAALEFVPTHVRVLASDKLSATEEVKITEAKGVSIISDVDDTIKHSSIASGAREIFRNTFIRDLADLTIEGVREWYKTMYDMGVGIHYVSNSPWQLFPVLVTFFRVADLPPGSYHLKQYSGMLQGIFEPVAERKKGTLERIMRDFPERRFILIGDSGEADLEVYTDVVLANPRKILAVFIRDVTTPEQPGFFNSAMGPLDSNNRSKVVPSRSQSGDSKISRVSYDPNPSHSRPPLPPRVRSEANPQTSDGPTMGKLIDFDDEPEQPSVHESHRKVMPRSASDFDLSSRKPVAIKTGRPPPPRPSKPVALRSNTVVDTKSRNPPPPPKPRRPGAQSDGAPSHPLSQQQSSAELKSPDQGYISSARNTVSAAYNALPEVRSYLPGGSTSENPPPPPPRRANTATATKQYASSGHTTPDSGDDFHNSSTDNLNAPINKKIELWKRRWKRAKDILDSKGVPLRSWRVGGDVCLEAVQLAEKTMREMGVEGYGNGNGKAKAKTGKGGGEVKVKDLK